MAWQCIVWKTPKDHSYPSFLLYLCASAYVTSPACRMKSLRSCQKTTALAFSHNHHHQLHYTKGMITVLVIHYPHQDLCLSTNMFTKEAKREQYTYQCTREHPRAAPSGGVGGEDQYFSSHHGFLEGKLHITVFSKVTSAHIWQG